MLVPVPAPLILLCTPIYAPDPGHEDREIQTEFHAIVHEDWKGVVTSSNTMARMLKVYTGARTFRATSWPELINMWHLDCTEYHNHVGEEAGPVPASKAPSPRAPGLLPSEDARARESKLCQAQMQDCANTARTSARGTRDLVSRVLAVKSSQLADRFDTLRIHSDASPPSVYQEPSSGTFNSYAHARINSRRRWAQRTAKWSSWHVEKDASVVGPPTPPMHPCCTP
ncbi:hypothetical protein MSAN_02044100 [Mycena sanguinolenta]|uniref:Uncharacterized protein n=1 Tax=Mycena sanguinolenta TaxID=230812 RepID=A0A8H6XKA3_9AGAR|nr:hypothetical protein MSAN_02044100 [Mycena sanguinolenta]